MTENCRYMIKPRISLLIMAVSAKGVYFLDFPLFSFYLNNF